MLPHSNYFSDENAKFILQKVKDESKKPLDSKISLDSKITLDSKIPLCNAGTVIQEKPAYYKIDDLSPVVDSGFSTGLSTRLSKQVLDPLSVIIKLAILSKKSMGCKLCIMNNVLYIQEPGLFQPLVRYVFHSSKEDLSFLYNPIETACEYFLYKSKEENKEMKNLFLMAQKGLKQLIEQYRGNATIVHTLYMYNNLIMNYIGTNYNEDLFIPDEWTEAYQNEYVHELNEKWSEGKIKMVLDMLDFIDLDENTKKNVKCLEEFMVNIDNETMAFFSEWREVLEKEKEKEKEKEN